MLYVAGIKPTVSKTKQSSFPKGIVVLSADFEMAWAFRVSKRVKDAKTQGLKERSNVPKIIGYLEEYRIPITWATVGHLFLNTCSNQEGGPHPDMPRPEHFENRNWKFDEGDWYSSDPCSTVHDDPAWYAPDLIDLILNSKQRHEIGCHTFSHIDFSYKNCPSELAEAEIKKCRELAGRKGLNLLSMVFPGGTEGNFEVLKKEGFTNYRKPMPNDIDMPIIDSYGLVAIPSSYGMDKPIYNWNDKFCFKIAKSHIDIAVKHKMVCHLWFHPSMHYWYLEKIFPKILQYLAAQRNNGKIEIMTMGKLAERILSSRKKKVTNEI